MTNFTRRSFLGSGAAAAMAVATKAGAQSPEGLLNLAQDNLDAKAAAAEADTSCREPEVNAQNGESEAYKIAVTIHRDDFDPSVLQDFNDDELAELRTAIIGYAEENRAKADDVVALMSRGGGYLDDPARGTHILSTRPQNYNPANSRRNLGAFGEVLQGRANALVETFSAIDDMRMKGYENDAGETVFIDLEKSNALAGEAFKSIMEGYETDGESVPSMTEALDTALSSTIATVETVFTNEMTRRAEPDYEPCTPAR